MKLMASWFRSNRGLAIGVLVGSLTLGSGSPHLITAGGSLPWRGVLLVSSALAVLGAALIWLSVREGPYTSRAPSLAPGYVIRMFRDRPQRLVNIGYFGHMWELYAVWAWLPAYVSASLAARWAAGGSHFTIELTSFAAIGVAGLAGAVLGGLLSDRFGRAALTIGAMGVSGVSCLLSVAVFGLHPALVIGLLLIWGGAVIADSAQFSTALTELADQRYVGTALTAQTAIGFLLTVASIRFVPWLAGETSWRYAFAPLAAGPLLGIVAMMRLPQRSAGTALAPRRA
jgi:predicted MFS family arabinose efflux permease